MTDCRSDLIEREWTDEFGTHYEVRGVSEKGLFSCLVTRGPYGWPKERETAAERVKTAMASGDLLGSTRNGRHNITIETLSYSPYRSAE